MTDYPDGFDRFDQYLRLYSPIFLSALRSVSKKNERTPTSRYGHCRRYHARSSTWSECHASPTHIKRSEICSQTFETMRGETERLCERLFRKRATLGAL